MTIKRKIEIQAWEHPFDRQHFTKQEATAYSNGASIFQELAVKSASEPIQKLLGNLSQDQPMFVEMFSTSNQPWENWFGFTIVLNEYQPRIRLPRLDLALPTSTPTEVDNLYHAFGGFTDSSFCGGFMKTEDVVGDADRFTMDHHEISIDGCHFFFDYGNGDYAGWHDSGSGVMNVDHLPTVHSLTYLRQCLQI